MKESPAALSEIELQRQREQISRGLQRLNTAAIIILLVVLALALAAILESHHREGQRRRAETAERDARKKLYETYLARARAERLTDAMGRRERSLHAIQSAVELHAQVPDAQTTALRNEAIATLAMIDLELPDSFHPLPTPRSAYALDADLTRSAVAHSNGLITVQPTEGSGRTFQFVVPSRTEAASLSFSPAGQYLIAIDQQGAVILLPLESNLPPVQIDAGPARSVDLSPDGQHIAVLLQDGGARVLAASAPGKILGTLPGVNAAVFHPTTNVVAGTTGSRIRFFNFEGREVWPAITNVYGATQLAFRPDGRQIAAVNPYLSFTLWDLRTREPLRLQTPLGDFYQLVYDPSGETITAALGDGVSRIWSTRTGELLHKLESGRITGFNRNGDRLAFESPREGFAVGRFARSPALTWLRWSPAQDYFRRFWSVEFSDDGRWVAATDLGYLVVWDARSGQRVASSFATPRRLNVMWLPGEKSWLTANSAGFSVYPTEEKQALRNPRHTSISNLTNNLGQSTLSPDGRTLAVVANSQLAWLIDVKDPARRRQLEFKGPGALGHLAFSPDGKQIASSATAGTAILVWDAIIGRLLHQIPGAHGRVVFSPDGQQLVLGTARDYTFWDTKTWKMDPARTLTRDNLAETTGALTFSPDGKTLALARTRQLVQLIDPVTGRELASLNSPRPQTVSWLRFSPNGDQLAVATFDGAVQLWNLGWLQSHLGQWDLDWTKTPAMAAVAPEQSRSRQQLLVLPLAAILLVLAFVLFAFQRQRHLFSAYVQVEQLAAARAQALQAAQTEIVHAQKMKALGTLAAGIAHDFNNLLSVIRMSNQLTAEETSGNASIRENVHEIEQAVAQGKRVVRSMLGYSREGDAAEGPIEVPDLIEDTVALLTRQFLNGITLTLELDRELPPVHQSRHRLEQILLNLIVNASEAMNGQGRLQIVVRRGMSSDGATILRPRAASSYAELSISDSGPGIDPQILPRIFEPFFTTKNRGASRGTGLGLSTVYATAEQEGLGLGVRSAPLQGASFRIVIPLEPKPSEATGAEPDSTPATSRS